MEIRKLGKIALGVGSASLAVAFAGAGRVESQASYQPPSGNFNVKATLIDDPNFKFNVEILNYSNPDSVVEGAGNIDPDGQPDLLVGDTIIYQNNGSFQNARTEPITTTLTSPYPVWDRCLVKGRENNLTHVALLQAKSATDRESGSLVIVGNNGQRLEEKARIDVSPYMRGGFVEPALTCIDVDNDGFEEPLLHLKRGYAEEPGFLVLDDPTNSSPRSPYLLPIKESFLGFINGFNYVYGGDYNGDNAVDLLITNSIYWDGRLLFAYGPDFSRQDQVDVNFPKEIENAGAIVTAVGKLDGVEGDEVVIQSSGLAAGNRFGVIRPRDNYSIIDVEVDSGLPQMPTMIGVLDDTRKAKLQAGRGINAFDFSFENGIEVTYKRGVANPPDFVNLVYSQNEPNGFLYDLYNRGDGISEMVFSGDLAFGVASWAGPSEATPTQTPEISESNRVVLPIVEVSH